MVGRLFAAALLACCASSALAETIEVDLFYDAPDADLGDGVCDADLTKPGEQHTLRAAVQHANVTPGNDTVLLKKGKYKLTIQGAGENAAATGDLDITDQIVLLGDNATTTFVDGKKAKDRVFDIRPGVSALIFCVTIQGGKTAAGESGAGFRNEGDLDLHDVRVAKCKSADDAGGIHLAAGAAALSKVWVTKCKSADRAGGIGVDGGTFSLDSSTVSKCKAKDGGGIDVSGRTTRFTNVTISGNKATGDGGGVALEDGTAATFSHCTVAFNKAPSGAGVNLKSGTDSALAINSIFALNKPSNSNNALDSNGGNIDSGSTCDFLGDDLSETNPLLLKLAFVDSDLPTHPLKTGSPAIGLAIANCDFSDARGFPRTAPCDSGAFQTTQIAVVLR